MTEAKKYASKRVSSTDYPVYNDEYELELAFEECAKWQSKQVWHDKKEPLPIGEIAIIRYNSIVIGWANDTRDGIEDEHGRLITKDFTKWALVKDLI